MYLQIFNLFLELFERTNNSFNNKFSFETSKFQWLISFFGFLLNNPTSANQFFIILDKIGCLKLLKYAFKIAFFIIQSILLVILIVICFLAGILFGLFTGLVKAWNILISKRLQYIEFKRLRTKSMKKGSKNVFFLYYEIF